MSKQNVALQFVEFFFFFFFQYDSCEIVTRLYNLEKQILYFVD